MQRGIRVMRTSLAIVWLGLLGAVGCGEGSVPASPTSSADAEPRRPSPTDHWIAAGSAHTCAVHEGQVWCNGSGAAAGEPDRTIHPPDPPYRIALPAPARSLTAGAAHACALDDRGSVHCWGMNQHGQLGAGGCDLFSVVPRRVPLPKPATQVVSDSEMTCALLEDHTVMCWGSFRETVLRRQSRPLCAPQALMDEHGRVIEQVVEIGTSAAVTREGRAYVWRPACDFRCENVTDPLRAREIAANTRPENEGGPVICPSTFMARFRCWGETNLLLQDGSGRPIGARLQPTEASDPQPVEWLMCRGACCAGVGDGTTLCFAERSVPPWVAPIAMHIPRSHITFSLNQLCVLVQPTQPGHPSCFCPEVRCEDTRFAQTDERPSRNFDPASRFVIPCDCLPPRGN